MTTTSDYETRTTRRVVTKKGAPIFDASATMIEIENEAAGEFVIISQCRVSERGDQIRIDPTEWPHIRDAIDRMIAECRV